MDGSVGFGRMFPGGPDGKRAGRSSAGLVVGVLLDEGCLGEREPRALAAALGARGAQVTLATPDEPAAGFPGCDAVVARGRSPDLLAALERFEAEGIPTLNRSEAIRAVADGSAARAVLARAGIRTEHPLAGGASAVVTLYVAGGEVHAVRRPLGAEGTRPAARVPVDASSRALALDAGACFGLDLYGVECLELMSGLAVARVTAFPNFTGVPEADLAAAALVVGRAAGRAP